MQNSRPVLLTAAVSGVVATVAALFGADQFAAQAAVLALGALGVLVAAWHDTARRVRWSFFVGLAALAVAVAVPDLFAAAVNSPQALTPAAGGAGSFVPDVVAGEWPTTTVVLTASVAFWWALTAATARPSGRSRRWRNGSPPDPVVLAAAAGSLLIIVTVADLVMVAAAQKGDGEAAGLLTAVAPPLAVALLAIGSALFGAYRLADGTDGTGQAAGAVAAGGLFLAVAALSVVHLGILSAPLGYGAADNLILSTVTIPTGWGDLDLFAAARLAGLLAGAGGTVYGTARAPGTARAAAAVSPDGPPA